MSTSSTDSGWVLYQYTPNKGGAIAVVIIFILLTLIYAFQCIWEAKEASRIAYGNPFENEEEKSYSEVNESSSGTYQKLTMSSTFLVFIPFFVGCLMEVVGYIGRVLSSSNPEAITPYIIQSILLLVAPALYAATIYMIFGRLLRVMRCQSLMIISARYGTTFFVFGDVLSFLMQAGGGGLMTKEKSRKTGTNLITAGLAVQIVFFAFFIVNQLRFLLRVAKECPFYRCISKRWKLFNYTLLIASVLIMVRSIVRLIEFAQGFDGFIISHEYFIYAFDAVPMLFVIIFFSVGSYFGGFFMTIAECQSIKSRPEI